MAVSIIYSVALFAISGVIDGFKFVLVSNYKGFKIMFPKAKNQFWNPALSGMNKWRWVINSNTGDARDLFVSNAERFLFSTTILAWTTEGFRLLSAASLVVSTAGYLCLLSNFSNIINDNIVLSFSVCLILRALFFHAISNILKI